MAVDVDFIRKNVKKQLAWDDRIVASDIQVEVQDSTVRLKGIVPTYNAKLAAEADAQVIPGVMRVENLLDVRYPRDETAPSDLEIQNNILNMVRWNNHLDEKNINVLVEEGMITLEGSVSSYWKKALAEELTLSIKGVASVTNKLAVVPGNDVLDEVIADDIMNALERNQNIEVSSVNVKVQDGIVTLSGTVPDWHIRQEAYRTVLYTRGVVDIVDNLSIRSTTR